MNYILDSELEKEQHNKSKKKKDETINIKAIIIYSMTSKDKSNQKLNLKRLIK